MERVSSKQSFLNLNDATISDAGEEERSRTFVPIAKSRVVPDVQVPTDANTPRAAPSINLPMQQSDALKHVSIGARSHFGPLLIPESPIRAPDCPARLCGGWVRWHFATAAQPKTERADPSSCLFPIHFGRLVCGRAQTSAARSSS